MSHQSQFMPEYLMLAKWDPIPTKEECQPGLKRLSVPAVLPVCLDAGQYPASREFADNAQRDLRSAIGFLNKLRHDAGVHDHTKYDNTLQLYKRVYSETSDVLAGRPFPK
jgi:hypothetical protein